MSVHDVLARKSVHDVVALIKYALALSDGMYWVKNVRELDETISMLLSGKDPLSKKREELMKKSFFMPEGGSGLAIKEHIATDYRNCCV